MDNAAVIIVWARRFSVPKKSVNPMVRMAPVNSTNHKIPGTMPEAYDEPSPSRLGNQVKLMKSLGQ
jgi:hypothetical protein